MRLRALALLFILLLPETVLASSQYQQYRYKRWGFCVEVPKGWRLDEGVNGAGGRFLLPVSNAEGSVAVGALPNQCVDEHDAYGTNCDRKQTLQEIESVEESALKAAGATNIQTISSDTEQFQLLAAVRIRRSFVEQGRPVIDQALRFIKDGNVYAIEFQCSPADVNQCESAFLHMAESFKFQCN